MQKNGIFQVSSFNYVKEKEHVKSLFCQLTKVSLETKQRMGVTNTYEEKEETNASKSDTRSDTCHIMDNPRNQYKAKSIIFTLLFFVLLESAKAQLSISFIHAINHNNIKSTSAQTERENEDSNDIDINALLLLRRRFRAPSIPTLLCNGHFRWGPPIPWLREQRRHRRSRSLRRPRAQQQTGS